MIAQRGDHGSAAAVGALATRPGPDCFIATGEDVGLKLALLARMFGDKRRIYIIVHGSYFASSKFKWLVRALRYDARLFWLPLSGSLGWALVHEFGVPEKQVFNTSYGIDTHFLDPALEPATLSRSGPQLVVAAGAASRDYALLVRCVEDLADQARVYVAAGSTWFPITANAGSRPLPPHVVFERCPYPRLRSVLAAASFVVVPLYQGRHACGFGAIADAMAMGKAVIATRTEHYSDLIEDGVTGLYVEPGNEEQLRSAIRRLLEDRSLAATMGANARARVERCFSVEAYARRIERVVALTHARAL